jgi:hypothetical protein
MNQRKQEFPAEASHKIPDLPPMLRGSLSLEWRRCGRPRCRCGHGQRHGPYTVRTVWILGKRRRIYVRKSDVVATRRALAAHREFAQLVRLLAPWETPAWVWPVLAQLHRTGGYP